MHTSPGGPKVAQCFTDQADDETLGPWIDVRGYTNLTFYVSSVGTTSSGVVTFEECAPKDIAQTVPVPYGVTTGGYSAITTQNASTVSGGLQVAVHISSAAYYFVRARISTAIGGGGTISVGLLAT